MRPEWIDAVKKAWERERAKPSMGVQRQQLPMPAREAWDQYVKEALSDGSAKPSAMRFAVEGKNVFAISRASTSEGESLRCVIYDAAGHLVATGVSDAAGVTHWIGRN
jgi:hypothetical protein